MHEAGVLARQVLGSGGAPQGAQVKTRLLVDNISHLKCKVSLVLDSLLSYLTFQKSIFKAFKKQSEFFVKYLSISFVTPPSFTNVKLFFEVSGLLIYARDWTSVLL